MDGSVFTTDIFIDNALFGITIRSPVARGRIKEIKFPRLPTLYTPVRPEDIPGKNQLDGVSVPVLASETVSYIGEPVALLFGPDKAKLEEFAALCTVAVEKEPPFFSPHSVPPEKAAATRNIIQGEVEKAFGEATTVVEGLYRTGIQEHWYAESQAAVAEYYPNTAPGTEKIRIHTATQWPFQVKRSVASVLNLPRDTVEVQPSRIGVHLDGKIWYPSLIACHAALGAYITKKPVKFVLTREEDFLFTPKRDGSEIRIRSALGEKGQLLGTELDVTVALGAHGVFINEILDRICLGALGTYKIPNFKIEGRAVETNIPPGGPFAGFGLSQGFFAMERHVSHIADTLRQDPVEWRKSHLFYRNKTLAIGSPLKEHIPLNELLDTAAGMSDYFRKWASYELLRIHRREKGEVDKREPLRGIGIATAYQGSGLLYNEADNGACSVALTLEKDGSLEIRTSMVSSNKEHTFLWQNTAAEMLAVESDKIRVVSDTTETSPDSGPATLSRNITMITRLVERSCAAIRKQRFRDPLPITVSRSHRAGKLPDWEGKPMDPYALSSLGWGAAAVEVEIDPIEYIPRIRGAWLAIDGGRILSETRARRSLTNSVIQALGWASREISSYEEGIIPLKQLHGYNIPVIRDIPPIHIDFIWNDVVTPKGIEELPFSCVPAAYVQAVSQALDHIFEKIPLGAKDIWEAKKDKGEETQP